jgi:tetratricopeptide (TPR) repeat protein
MHFRRLRKKIGNDIIDTVRGIGYRLSSKPDVLGSSNELLCIYLIKLFTCADIERQTMLDEEWDSRYLPKIGDVRDALDWSLSDHRRRHIAIDLFGVTARLFDRASLIVEARSYVDQLLALIDDGISPRSAARLLRSFGILWRYADRLRALDMFQRSADFYRQVNDMFGLGSVLGLIGGTKLYLGRCEESKNTLEESIRLLSIQCQTKSLMNALNDLASVYVVKNMPDEATRYYDQALDMARMMNDTLRKYIIFMNLGDLEWCHGAPDRAIIRSREAEEGLRSAPIAYRVQPVVNLSTYLALQGEWSESRCSARKALALAREVGGYWLRLCLQVWALLGVRDGFHVKAARLIGYIDADFSRSGDARQRAEQQLYDLVLCHLGEALSKDSIRVFSGEGAHWTEAQAIDFAESLDKAVEIQ